MSKKVFFRTYGCQMNERDSEAGLAALIACGFETAESEETADILIFNTCSVRDQAELKAMGKIGITVKLKREKPDLIVGVMGCMAQSRGEEILAKMPHVNFVIGTDQLHRLPEAIERVIKDKKRPLMTRMDDPEILTAMSAHLVREPETPRVSGSVAISRGCSRHCAYCIVPAVRGSEKSRTVADILAEIRSMTESGIREILLLGQNVAAYGYDNTPPPLPDHFSPFADLLEQVAEIPGLARIRFTSPHPAYFNSKLIETLARLPKMCRHIHLPLQSGSDAILRRMNRPYTRAHYLSIVETLRRKMPDVSFSTDIIVGFPGETEEDFEATRAVMRSVGYSNAYIFKYSKRKDTPASMMTDQIPQAVKEMRNQILLEELKRSSEAYNESLVGQTVEVLVEGVSKRNASRWCGRTSSNAVTVFTPPATLQPGDLLRVRIERATSTTLYASVVSETD